MQVSGSGWHVCRVIKVWESSSSSYSCMCHKEVFSTATLQDSGGGYKPSVNIWAPCWCNCSSTQQGLQQSRSCWLSSHPGHVWFSAYPLVQIRLMSAVFIFWKQNILGKNLWRPARPQPYGKHCNVALRISVQQKDGNQSVVSRTHWHNSDFYISNNVCHELERVAGHTLNKSEFQGPLRSEAEL